MLEVLGWTGVGIFSAGLALAAFTRKYVPATLAILFGLGMIIAYGAAS